MALRSALAAACLAVAVLTSGCGQVREDAVAPPPDRVESSSTSVPATPTSLATAMRRWKSVAGEHFAESARALGQVSEASDAGDEAGVRSGCQVLHDTNSIGLQRHLPTPDPKLTDQLQRMIDDMNSATHACLRFALGRQPQDAVNYQTYLARAVSHLEEAKATLEADLRPR